MGWADISWENKGPSGFKNITQSDILKGGDLTILNMTPRRKY